MPNISHSKYKNTNLIYEFLIRQWTSEILSSKKNIKESKARKIISKHFSKGILKEELTLYQALVNNNFSNEYSAESIIQECLERYNKLSKKELNRKKYNLVKDIKENYDINKLFSTQVDSYKESASVYMLFESFTKNHLIKKAKYKGIIMESLLTPKQKREVRIMESIQNADPVDRKLAYYILIESYNKKFNSLLNDNQRKYIQEFVQYNTNENGWINDHINKIDKKLKSIIKESKGNKNNEIFRIKIQECKTKLDKLKEKRIFNETDHSKMLQFYKLIQEINEINVI